MRGAKPRGLGPRAVPRHCAPPDGPWSTASLAAALALRRVFLLAEAVSPVAAPAAPRGRPESAVALVLGIGPVGAAEGLEEGPGRPPLPDEEAAEGP